MCVLFRAGTEPRALGRLGKCSTTEPHAQAWGSSSCKRGNRISQGSIREIEPAEPSPAHVPVGVYVCACHTNLQQGVADGIVETSLASSTLTGWPAAGN